MLEVMTDSESPPDFPDEVPVPDAVEQTRPAVDPSDVDPDVPSASAEFDAPLESNESDWQEQRQVVEGFDEDDFR